MCTPYLCEVTYDICYQVGQLKTTAIIDKGKVVYFRSFQTPTLGASLPFYFFMIRVANVAKQISL